MEPQYFVVMTVIYPPDIGMGGHVAAAALHSITIGPFVLLDWAQDASRELRKGDNSKAKYRTVVVRTQ